MQSVLDQTEEALARYRAALEAESHPIAWRVELARLWYEQGRYKESRRELRTVLLEQPQHPQARTLITSMEHAIAESR
ncbi:MAG TPA: tetratricopeptide repeat protein [Gemmataceae bacterium]|nr:tetratricopeptide repeat protein [Gemmataceae bacterium]